MKNIFKPLGVAAAVTAASLGYVNVANAQTVANNALGDLALVPYYTVNGEWITGIHIVNTSDRTQVVKFRFRRAADSLDALDFNVIMSPQDVYAGFLSDDANGNIIWSADDTTCTAPAATNGALQMPAIYREGAETGYVEIIGMGTPIDETQGIAVAAKHTTDTLVPADCAAVRSNFFANGVAGTTRGVVDNENTVQSASTVLPAPYNAINDNVFDPAGSGNALKVSYFIRDNASGVEFGDNAVHIADFLPESAITNQQFGYLSGDLNGFDFPDLDGGEPVNGTRGLFEGLRGAGVLGVTSLINEWTANEANGAALSWIVTLPGQYLMLDMPTYVASLADPLVDCDTGTVAGGSVTGGGDTCDFRDIPVNATVVPYNREELTIIPDSGELTVSPALPGQPQVLQLAKETNVITFGGNNVLGVSDVDISADLAQPFGWLSLAVAPADPLEQAICAWDGGTDAAPGDEGLPAGAAQIMTCNAVVETAVPMVGFAAWVRNVAANPDASYGRAVAHSFN
jgi:hypothetical protein